MVIVISCMVIFGEKNFQKIKDVIDFIVMEYGWECICYGVVIFGRELKKVLCLVDSYNIDE